MADTTRNPPRIWRAILVVSLALNLAVVGLVAGVVVRDRVGGQAPRGFEMSLGPIGQALAQGDRREIGRVLRNDPRFRKPDAQQLRETLDGMVAVLTAQPFEQSDLRAMIATTRGRYDAAQLAATDALIARIAAMSDEERAAFADRLSKSRLRRR